MEKLLKRKEEGPRYPLVGPAGNPRQASLVSQMTHTPIRP
jgi:hypothetical protein